MELVCKDHVFQPQKPQPQNTTISNADRDKCLTSVLLSKWHRYIQVYLCETIRKEQARQKLVREITEGATAQREEQERRDSAIRLYCLSTNMRVMRILCGSATEGDLGSITAPVYERSYRGLRYVETKESQCWAPLGRVLPETEDDVPQPIEYGDEDEDELPQLIEEEEFVEEATR